MELAGIGYRQFYKHRTLVLTAILIDVKIEELSSSNDGPSFIS